MGESDTYNTFTYNDQTYAVTSVKRNAFAGVTVNQVIMTQLKDLDDDAFTGIRYNSMVDLSSSPLNEVPGSAFYYANTPIVKIPNEVTTIKGAAFFNSSIQQLIGGTISRIESYAFKDCSSLVNIDLSHVEYLATFAFSDCHSLSSVNLPQCLTTVEENVFYGCNLQSLSMYNTTSTFVESYAMMASNGVVTMNIVDWDNKNALTNRTCVPMAINYVYNNTPVTGNYTIPSAVTTLGEGALYHAAGLTGITLPASLTSMGQHAFGKCTTLTSITSNATTAPAVANANAFAEVNKSIPVTIPDNATTYYSYRHTTGWKDFTNYQVSLQTAKDVAERMLNEAFGAHSAQSVKDLLSAYISQINAATSKAEVDSLYAEAINALPLAIAKLECIDAVKAAAVGVVSDNLQALIDGYVTRINAATTIQAAEKVRDEAIAAFKLMKDKQPMIDALESKKVGVQSEAILTRIQGYIDYISKPSTTLAQATTKYNEAITILEYILEGYREGVENTVPVPTQPGMRLRVKTKDGKTYEFQTTNLEKVDYYRAR